MRNRGFTIVEMLIAVLITGFVSASMLGAFQFMHRRWSEEQDQQEASMIVQGISQEFSRVIRMTGAYVPETFGGFLIDTLDPSRLRMSVNLSGARRISVLDVASNKTTGKIRVYLDSISGFTDSGFTAITIKVPAAKVAQNPTPIRTDSLVICPIRGVNTGSRFIDVDVAPILKRGGWTWDGVLLVDSASQVIPIDSIEYRKSNDTLYKRVNRYPSMPYADQVDSLKFMYLQPGNIWNIQLPSTNTNKEILAVRATVYVRTAKSSPALRKANPKSDGYTRYQLVNEFTVRNSGSLRNKED